MNANKKRNYLLLEAEVVRSQLQLDYLKYRQEQAKEPHTLIGKIFSFAPQVGRELAKVMLSDVSLLTRSASLLLSAFLAKKHNDREKEKEHEKEEQRKKSQRKKSKK